MGAVNNSIPKNKRHRTTMSSESSLNFVLSTTILISVTILILTFILKNLGNIKNFYIFNIQYLWESPIKTLEARRKANKYYPFFETKNEEGEPVYRLSYRPSGWKELVATLIIVSVAIIRGILRDWDPDCIFLMSIIWFASCYVLIFKKWGKLTLDVETDGENYRYYTNNKLLYCGHVSDVYIRAKMGYSSGGGGEYYYLVLHGYNIEEFKISGKVMISVPGSGKTGGKLKDLKRLGKRTA